MVERCKCHDGYQFVIRPNRALGGSEALACYGIICATSLAIAISFLWIGLWVVLPFAGLELLALGAAFYYCYRRSSICEMITVCEDRVKVISDLNRPGRYREFIRGWTQVDLVRAWHPWYPSRLTIGSHGKQMEIGGFLTEPERVQLAMDLKGTVKV